MGQQPFAAAYLAEAERLFHGRLSPENLPHLTAQLPPVDRSLLDHLADHAAQLALTQPKHGWAVTAVAEAATAHTPDPFLQGLAAWHVARAANAWVRPQLVETAITRARAAFTKLDEPGWLAACDWQQHAEPWLHNNFQAAITCLEQALARLESGDLAHWAPHCRLSLAYGYILTAQFTTAETHISQSELVFQQQPDPLHQARCWLHRASALRRQLRYPEAIHYLENARQLFRQLEAPLDQARASYQLGYCELNQGGDYQLAEQLFASAATTFAETEIDLWQALCLNGLVQLYNNMGRLAEALRLLAQVKEIYACFPILGLQADTAVESGAQSLFQGDWAMAVQNFQEAETKYQQLNLPYMVAMATAYQGDAYTQANHYHQALHHLEKALVAFEQLEDNGRQAECHLRLAKVWLELGRNDLAHQHLQPVADYYECTQEPANFQAVFTYRAEILLRQQQPQQAVEILRHALTTSQNQGRQLHSALAQRALGEALCLAGEWEEGRNHLQTAIHHFQEMGAILEQAACLVSLSHYYQQIGDKPAARAAIQQALGLNQTAVPTITWQAHALLATIATEEGNQSTALAHYQEVVTALARLRQRIWQPTLYGSLPGHPSAMLNQAVTFAGQNGFEQQTLLFLEESKAQFLNRQMATTADYEPQTPELAELAAEIRWLQQKIADSESELAASLFPIREWHQQLIQKAQLYDLKVAQLERRRPSTPSTGWSSGYFAVDHFRQQANLALGQHWLALNYYLTGDCLYGVVLTPTLNRTWFSTIPPPVRLALDMCSKGGHGRNWPIHHLTTLGDWLLPKFIQEQLTLPITLLISPHRTLHRIPWAALHIGQPAQPLALHSTPVISPSWRTLLRLWQRSEQAPSPIRKGLALAVSHFPKRHRPLPQTRQEVSSLRQLFGDNLHLIQDEAATAVKLFHFAEAQKLNNYDFLHIASHAFTDQLTGRLSSLALFDRDIWLDEVYQLAPLPRLVTLSACSGILSRLLDGDEQIGLAIACLAAGAQQVVGSLWPVPDANLAEIMARFYAHLKTKPATAWALAETQRELYQVGRPITQWGSLQCVGLP
ncbi:MAG: CHAT domain-containing protein [Anaerolineae bacterium]|nr:CHAT domain-containing protein [Anaerolineae bacterium]